MIRGRIARHACVAGIVRVRSDLMDYETEDAVWAALERPVQVGIASPQPGEVVLTFQGEDEAMRGAFMSRKEAFIFGLCIWGAALRVR